MTVTVGSMCTGVGGLDLGLERAGMTVAWQAETNGYASRVLAKHWPHVPNLGDITTADWSSVPRVDLICAGYPCQPFSTAGRRGGVDDPRHLWPHIAGALRILRPRWALFENVPGHLTLGFDTVLADLAGLGFDAEWELLPAAAFGAPHLRYRLFVVAHAHGQGEPGGPVDAQQGPRIMVPDADSQQLRVGAGGVPRPARPGEGEGPQRERLRSDARQVREVMADAIGPGPQERCACHSTHIVDWTVPERRDWWDVEPDVGRVADGVPARVDRLRCLGNAVVPQVAQWIGARLLEQMEAAA